MRKRLCIKTRIDEWAGDLGIRKVGRIPVIQRLGNTTHMIMRFEALAGLTLPFLGLEHGNVHDSLPRLSTGSQFWLPYAVASPIAPIGNRSWSSRSSFTKTIARPPAPEALRPQGRRDKPVPSSSKYRLHVLASRPLPRL